MFQACNGTELSIGTQIAHNVMRPLHLHNLYWQAIATSFCRDNLNLSYP